MRSENITTISPHSLPASPQSLLTLINEERWRHDKRGAEPVHPPSQSPKPLRITSVGTHLSLNTFFKHCLLTQQLPNLVQILDFMLRSHRHVKAGPVSAMWDEFAKLSGTWLSHGSYGSYMAVTRSTWLIQGLRPALSCENHWAWLIRNWSYDKSPPGQFPTIQVLVLMSGFISW